MSDELGDALALLTPKQRFVVSRLWSLEGHERAPLRELAAVMGISHVGVWRIEQRALARIPPLASLAVSARGAVLDQD